MRIKPPVSVRNVNVKGGKLPEEFHLSLKEFMSSTTTRTRTTYNYKLTGLLCLCHLVPFLKLPRLCLFIFMASDEE